MAALMEEEGVFSPPHIQQQEPKGGKGILLAFSQPLPHAASVSPIHTGCGLVSSAPSADAQNVL